MTNLFAKSVFYLLLAKGLAAPASEIVKANASVSKGKIGSDTTVVFVPMEILVNCIKKKHAEILDAAKQKDGSIAWCLKNATPNIPFGSIEV